MTPQHRRSGLAFCRNVPAFGSGGGAERSCLGPSAVGRRTEVAAAALAAAKGADMFTRARLIYAGLLAAATTAALVGGPAMVQAGITFNFLD
jgi:hypothetical protein